MSKTIYLLRHAKAEAGDAGMSDADRPLSEKGRDACEIIGKIIKKQALVPSLVLCSNSHRTKETWGLVSQAAQIDPPVEYSRRLYLATAGEIAKHIQVLDDAVSSVLVVAHNPGVHEFVLKFCAQGTARAARKIELKYPTGSLAVIECEISRWAELAPECGFLKEFITPGSAADD